ncbi:vacuolar-processing enzyme-like [Camellia sinensis]|uniref:vacuolar-processing enzyme-like n=1 Tax=Camellia sinensis TaxID=4442 RepID=UPI001035EA55|nr:vacuolar-processing enzyme-like [Camellia sinensis]
MEMKSRWTFLTLKGDKELSMVNFPVKNLELKDYIPLPTPKENEKLRSKYDLIANIVHDGKPDDQSNTMMFIGKFMFESENGLLMLETVRPAGQSLVDDWNCLKTLVRTYKEHCGSLSRYGMTYMHAIANMCNAGVKMEQMTMASAQACMGTTLIHAAPSTMN